MHGLIVKVVHQDIATVEAEALVVGCYEDVRPLKGMAGRLDWLLCGALSDLLSAKKMKGALGDAALLTTRGKAPARKVFLIGLGPQDACSPQSLQNAVRNAVAVLCGAGVGHAALEFLHPPQLSFDVCAAATRDGIIEGSVGCSLSLSLVTTDRTAGQQLNRILKYSVEQEHQR